MLCIAYTSKVKLEAGQTGGLDSINQILHLARKKNQDKGITSALLYNDGMFLQVIEGEAKEVDTLFEIIRNDDRHEAVEKIIDIPIKTRAFTGKSIHLLLSLHENAQLINFIAENKEILLSSSPTDIIKEKFSHFGCNDLENLQSTATTSDNLTFKDLSFMLKKEVKIDWFEIGMLKPEIAIAGIQLSDKLLLNACTYEELLESKQFGTPDELSDLLNTLGSTGNLLKIKEIAPIKNTVSKPKKTVTKKASFRHKLLSWLKNSDGI